MAKHEVEILNGRPGGTFDEIVFSADGNNAIFDHTDCDIAVVRVGNVSCVR